MMGLPSHRQAQRIKAKDIVGNTYMPGLNFWAFEMASKKEVKPLQVRMDGTRVVRIIELYKDEFLVGESFSPDV
jgi:predicted cupin superfamily sugar epimerase